MPNRLLIAALLAAVPAASHSAPAVDGHQGEVIALCASPQGLSRYFRGDIVAAQGARPASAAMAQELSLVRRDGADDLLLHADGVVRSIRATGAGIETVVAEGGAIHHLMVEQDGYMDHFVFQAAAAGDTPGKVVWATQRVARDKAGTMLSAPCAGN